MQVTLLIPQEIGVTVTTGVTGEDPEDQPGLVT